jgi:hypothetical protein
MGRAVSAAGKWWSEPQKLEAVKTHLITGNLALTASMLKIPEDTLRRWIRMPWWAEVVADFKDQDELQLSARLKNIVNKTWDVVEDRLQNGDFVYDQKTGAMRRKPVAMRDAHKVGVDLHNQRELLLNKHAPRASEEAIDDKLNKLAAKFAAIVQGRQAPSQEIVDVESKVVYPESLSDEVLPDGGEDNSDGFLQEEEGRMPLN